MSTWDLCLFGVAILIVGYILWKKLYETDSIAKWTMYSLVVWIGWRLGDFIRAGWK
jgi:uncharacterized membrane protein YbjE (DUF340 family)